MAKIKFNRGTKTKINSSAISDGSLNLATDDGTLYADVSSTKRIELNPQSDWSITDTSSKGYIRNKPDLSKYETVTSATSYYSTLQSNINKKQDILSFDNTPTYGSSNPVTSGGTRVYVDGKIPTKMSQLTNDSGYGKYIKYAVTITSSSVVSSTTHSSEGFGYSFSLGYGGCTSDWYADIVFPSTFKDPYWLETGTDVINVYFISKPSSTLNCTLILIHG